MRTEGYWKKLRTQAQGNELPDVFWMNGPNIQLYAGNGMLAPIDKVTDAGVKWSDYPEALVKLYTYDGKHYGVPKDFDTIGVFYNKKIFKDAGVELPTADWTWDDFHDKAKKISDWGKSKGIYGCATTINGDGQGTYYNTIFQAGGFVIKDDKSGFDDPKSIEGLQCWADWVKDGSVASPKVITDTKPSQMFKSGKSAMYWSGDWTASELAEEFKGHENDYDVIVLPKKRQEGHCHSRPGMGGFSQVGQPSRRTGPRRPHGLQAGTGDGSSERYRHPGFPRDPGSLAQGVPAVELQDVR